MAIRMRIVGGKYRGRKLAAPTTQKIRPTTDRTRESLFNILANKVDFEDARIIDVFAGTGALGLEAMSRGGSFALFVEESAEGRGLLRTNTQALDLQGKSKISKRDATKLGHLDAGAKFDIAFLDPPYGKKFGEKAIEQLLLGDWLNEGALIVLEEASEALPTEIDGLKTLDIRKFGETSIGFFEQVI